MVLIQEMALKVDQGFLGAVISLFTPTTDPEAERKRVTIFISWAKHKEKISHFWTNSWSEGEKINHLIFFFQTKLIQQDIDALNTELMESSMTDMSILSFFEHFHISPVKVCF